MPTGSRTLKGVNNKMRTCGQCTHWTKHEGRDYGGCDAPIPVCLVSRRKYIVVYPSLEANYCECFKLKRLEAGDEA